MNDTAQETTAVMVTLVEHKAGILLVSLLGAVKKRVHIKMLLQLSSLIEAFYIFFFEIMHFSCLDVVLSCTAYTVTDPICCPPEVKKVYRHYSMLSHTF